MYLIVFIVLLTYFIILINIFFNNKIINPYNKYKIYYDVNGNYYFVKYFKTYWLPIYVKYEETIHIGFEDYIVETIKFKSINSAKIAIENEYKNYVNNLKPKKNIKKVFIHKK